MPVDTAEVKLESNETLISGITPKMWGKIGCIFAVLYLCLGCYYAFLMTAALEIRDTEYLDLPVRFYGDFDRTTGAPKGCYDDITEEVDTLEDFGITASNIEAGDLYCSQNKKVWNSYPWVFFTNDECSVLKKNYVDTRRPENNVAMGYARGGIKGKCQNP